MGIKEKTGIFNNPGELSSEINKSYFKIFKKTN